MPQREWTGSVAVLPKAMRELAVTMASLADRAHRDGVNEPKASLSEVQSFLRDEAYSLSEWADAIEQLYARLDAGDGITNAQMVTLGRLMRDYKADSATVAVTGSADLLAFDLQERGSFIVNGGIEPDGRAHT